MSSTAPITTPAPRPSWLPGPIVAAPMAGGPSTPELVAAVTAAGGFGFLAAGYLTAEALGHRIDRLRGLGVGHFGVNIFCPPTGQADAAALERYARALTEANPFGVTPGPMRADDDEYRAKLDLMVSARVPVVSFTFGLPDAAVVRLLQDAGAVVLATVTNDAEARSADALGVDALTVQGPEAGGHRGTFVDADTPDARPLLTLVTDVAAVTTLPLVAAGGIATAAHVEAALAAGACAVQVGTALLLADEAGTSELHRAALVDPAFDQTVVSRCWTGRPARGLRTAMAAALDELAPSGYPAVRQLVAPIRQAADRAEDAQWVSLWAGTGWRQISAGPAEQLVARLQAGQYTIRRATPGDAEQFAAVREQSMREAYAHFMPQAFFDRRAAQFDQEVADHHHELARAAADRAAGRQPFHDFWVAADPSGRLVGMATVGRAPADWEADLDVPPPVVSRELAQLYTLADVHGTGVGQRLLDAALPDGGEAYLWIMSDNPRAARFYERNGFVADGVSSPAGESWFGIGMFRMVRGGDQAPRDPSRGEAPAD